MGMAMTNRFVALNYREKENVRSTLEMAKHYVGFRETYRKKNGKDVYKKSHDAFGVTNEEETELKLKLNNEQSNVFERIWSCVKCNPR